MRITLFLALLLALIVTVFAVQNFDTVEVNFLTWNLTGSLALVLLLTLSAGIAIGILVSAPTSLRRRRELGGLKKSMRKMEKELAMARQTPSEPRSSMDEMGETEEGETASEG
jgi:putative membrane protein